MTESTDIDKSALGPIPTMAAAAGFAKTFYEATAKVGENIVFELKGLDATLNDLTGKNKKGAKGSQQIADHEAKNNPVSSSVQKTQATADEWRAKMGHSSAVFTPRNKYAELNAGAQGQSSLGKEKKETPSILRSLQAKAVVPVENLSSLSQDMLLLIRAGNNPERLNELAHTSASQQVQSVAKNRLADKENSSTTTAASAQGYAIKFAENGAPSPDPNVILRVTQEPTQKKAELKVASQKPAARVWAGLNTAPGMST